MSLNGWLGLTGQKWHKRKEGYWVEVMANEWNTHMLALVPWVHCRCLFLLVPFHVLLPLNNFFQYNSFIISSVNSIANNSNIFWWQVVVIQPQKSTMMHQPKLSRFLRWSMCCLLLLPDNSTKYCREGLVFKSRQMVMVSSSRTIVKAFPAPSKASSTGTYYVIAYVVTIQMLLTHNLNAWLASSLKSLNSSGPAGIWLS